MRDSSKSDVCNLDREFHTQELLMHMTVYRSDAQYSAVLTISSNPLKNQGTHC